MVIKMIQTKNKNIYFIIIAILLIVIQLSWNSGLSFDLGNSINQLLKGGSIEPKYEEILPEAGHCTDKGLKVDYITFLNKSSEREPIEYCRLDKFCEIYDVSIVLNEQPFNEEKLQKVIDDNPDRYCFTEEAQHTQRNIANAKPSDYIKSKFVCCNNEDPLIQLNCEKNTCNGRYTGVRDEHDCKIYAVYHEDEWVAGCGGYFVVS